MAPLSIQDNAVALSFFIFTRSFFQAWGITIGATVLQNRLKSLLPQAFVAQFPDGIEVSYAAITQIASLPDSDGLKRSVQDAFAASLRTLWFVLLGISVVGLLSAIPMRDMALQTETDENWGLKGKDQQTGDKVVETPMEELRT